MRFTQIRDLLAIVDSGGMRSAARSLGVTPPVLSRSIRDLEKELGVQLLERTAHGAVPTRAGKAFLARASVIENELARIREEAGRSTGFEGTLVFGVGIAAMPIVPAALAAFRAQHPALELRIVGGTAPSMLPQLREGRLEFALGFIPPGLVDKHIKTQPLFRLDPDRWHVVGRRGHPLRNARSLRELAGAGWLLRASPYGEPAQAFQQFNGRFIREGVPPPESLVLCQDTGTFLTVLAETDMISIMNGLQLDQRPWKDVLEPFAIRLPGPDAGRTVRVYFRADSPLTPPVAALVAILKAEARKLASAQRR